MVLDLSTVAPSEFSRLVEKCLEGRHLAKVELCSLQFPRLQRQADVGGFSGSPNEAVISAMERHCHIGDSVMVLSRLLIGAKIDSWKSWKYHWSHLLFVHDIQLQQRNRVNFVFDLPWEAEERQPKLHHRYLLSKLALC